jgi:hypothetical protein
LERNTVKGGITGSSEEGDKSKNKTERKNGAGKVRVKMFNEGNCTVERKY